MSGFGILLRTRSCRVLLTRQILCAPTLADRAGCNQPIDLVIGVVQVAENGARGGAVLLRWRYSRHLADCRTDGEGVELSDGVPARMVLKKRE